MQTPLVDSPRHAQKEKIIKQRSPSLILDNDSVLEERILDNNDFMLKELLLFSLFYAGYFCWMEQYNSLLIVMVLLTRQILKITI